ncbi:MAG: thiamine diphosphokinase [Clostridiales bacterium]|jgi:thiamine pyrophosphokinase|nr:thiamine diphosphokinase [Clostridiales bacterium]
MKKALLFLNGDPPTQEYLSDIDRAGRFVLCADGAYRYLKGVIRPDLILGDFDSLLDADADGIGRVRFDADKDYTDGHLAVEYLLERGYADIDIYGAFGGRADHAYANLSLLYQAKLAGARARLLDERQCVMLKSGRITLKNVKGRTISLEPFLTEAHIILTKGFKYNLRDKTLDRRHILGISNVALSDTVGVEAEGELLLFIERLPGDR